ncbi:MAG: efflux RND transporter permease subunit [Calditrichia bacterium]
MKTRNHSKIAEFAINRPVTISMVLLALLMIGFISYNQIPVEMMPTGFNPPFMGVWIPYRNANPEEIEEQIAKPMEEELRTISGLSEVTSRSMNNGAWVWIEFHSDMDMDVAYDMVRDRVERARLNLPDDIDRIMIRKFGPDNSSIMNVSISIPENVKDPYYFVEHFIKNPIERIDGVASVDIYGADEKIIQILIDDEKVKAYNVNLFETINSLRNDNFNLSSGWVKEGGKKFFVRSISKFQSLEEIQNIPIKGANVRLKDVANIIYAPPEKEWFQRINGKDAFKIEISKENMANTVEISHKVKDLMDEFKADPKFAGAEFQILFDQGAEIEQSIDNLKNSAIWGAIFAILILYFFLRRLKMTLIVAIAIPLSVMISLIVMYFMGWTLNVITMMGLMISVGMVIDNSIVVLENIFRHQGAGMKIKKAAIFGTGEVSLAVTMATLTSIVVFVPILLIKDDVGFFRFYLQRVGIPVIFALLASLFVAIVMIPIATTKFPLKTRIREKGLILKGLNFYKKSLAWALSHRVEVSIVLVIIMIATIQIAKQIPSSGNMGGRSSRIFLIFDLPQNISLEEINEYFTEVEAAILEKKEKYDISAVDLRFRKDRGRIVVYQNPLDNKQWFQQIYDWFAKLGGNEPEVIRDRDKVLAGLKQILPEKPGVKVRTSWRGGESAEEGTVSVVIYGEDTGKLMTIAEEVERRMQLLPDVISTETSLETGNDEMQITLDRDMARRSGINPNQVAFSIMYAVRGIDVSKFQSTDREIQIRVQLEEQDRQNFLQLRNMTFRNREGKNVPLAALAEFSVNKGFGEILRTNGRTNIEVKATTNMKNMRALSADIDNMMKNFTLPYGYTWSKGRQFDRWMQQNQSFASALQISVVFVLILMGILFESFMLPLSVLISIPLSFFGAFTALYITGQSLEIIAYIGLIVLIGIVVNNAIVLIDLTNRYREDGMSRTDAIMEAGRHRFRPILMTAATTIAGILPIALGEGKVVGTSIAPMGITIIGGMLVSSALTLIAVPVIYTLVDDLRLWGIRVLKAQFAFLQKKVAKKENEEVSL